jgi:hypothetical protein
MVVLVVEDMEERGLLVLVRLGRVMLVGLDIMVGLEIKMVVVVVELVLLVPLA